MTLQKPLIVENGTTQQLPTGDGLSLNAQIAWTGTTGLPVSAAGSGTIYFDSGTNTFRVSQDGGAYADLAVGAAAIQTLTGNFSGQLVSTVAGTARWYPPTTVTISKAWASIGETAAGVTTFDVLKNGVSILPSPITIAAGTYRAPDVAIASVPLTTSDWLTISLTTVNGGSNATVFVEYT
jgi:hypothetical protein